MIYVLFFVSAAVGPLALALLLRQLGEHPPAAIKTRWPWRSPVWASLALWLAIAAIMMSLYRLAAVAVTHSVTDRLQSVAVLKRDLVVAWLDDVRNDLRVSAGNPALARLLLEWRAAPQDPTVRGDLIDYLWRLGKTAHYDSISVRDSGSGGIVLTTTGDSDTLDVRRQAIRSVASPEPLIEDFHLDAQRVPRARMMLGAFVAVPLPDASGPVVIHVGIVPTDRLFPLVGRSAGIDQDGDALLLRSDGKVLRVLNDSLLAAVDGAAPASASALVSGEIATAVLRGRTGAIAGGDAQGKATFAHVLPIAGTGWLLMVTRDRDAAFAHLETVALMTAALFGALNLLGTWWWVERRRRDLAEQRHRHDQERLMRRIVEVQEEERRRWSSELHDRTGANLATINLNLKAIAKSILQPSSEDVELLEETHALVTDSVGSIREFCSTLRPTMLEYSGLVPALAGSLAQFGRRTAMETHFNHAGFAGRCTAEHELMLFRIAQEALLNCAKHARAGSVSLTLDGEPDHLRLRIEDDGVGFERTEIERADADIGHGLLSMRERAAFIGGKLSVDSARGRGTRVTITIGDLLTSGSALSP